MSTLKESNRKIHLDFHTPHWVKRVGQHYDPVKLVETWKEARVNAVTVVFGLCACGNAYYETEVGQMHPGLEQDLLTPLLPVAKEAGIRIYVHFSTGIHDRAVIEHPEWSMQRKDDSVTDSWGSGRLLDTDGGTKWGWPCFNSPFVERLFWPQLREFVHRFPEVSGIFLDMVMYPANTCYCSYCRSKAVAWGLDIHRREGMEELQRRTLTEFMLQTRSMIHDANSGMEFTCNNQWYIGGARHEALDFIELEAPVSWNSYHYPVMARYIRTIGKPAGGMTTRFPKNWGYFGSLNNSTQLKFECAEIMSTLGSCCIGDQLHPSGIPDTGVYELIGDAYRFVEEREAWALNAESVPYVAVVADLQRSGEVSGADSSYYAHQSPKSLYGAGLVLLEDSRHFDVLDEYSSFENYKLLWLPENITLSPSIIPRIVQYVADGGKLLVTGSGLWQQPAWREALELMADVKLCGIGDSNGEYLQLLEPMNEDIPNIPYFMKDRFLRWKPGQSAASSAKITKPYEGINAGIRFGHFHAPFGEQTEYDAIVTASYGKGKITAVAPSLAAEYFNVGSRHIRKMTLHLIDSLVPPEERIVEVNANSPSIEASLMSQQEHNRWVLHLVQYAAKRHTGNTVIEEIPERRNIEVVLRPPQAPKRAYLAPSCDELMWTTENGAVCITVPELHIHQMLVVEY